MNRTARHTIALGLAAALPTLLAACGRAVPAARAATAVEEEAVPVVTAPVARGPVDRPVRAAGTVATKDEWDLSFKVGGLLAAVEVHEGQAVRRGQVLATLDPTELSASVRQAREGAVKARRDAERLALLAGTDAAPRAAADDTRTAAAVADAALAAAEFNLRHAT
ncbi:MAG TPA: biotin/lipoyl-binding protein, partial [Anaeromyxobacteraceae bacterium]|nr:biotin/lipoyl-binding protein [Anaeromyxobacteraceae bacterium]